MAMKTRSATSRAFSSGEYSLTNSAPALIITEVTSNLWVAVSRSSFSAKEYSYPVTYRPFGFLLSKQATSVT